ncbi:MAG: inorganic phosphate transporter, partial [Bacteroidota bacterium]
MELIVSYGPWFIGLAIVFGLYMCWGIGANDVANAMGTSVGSRAITVKQAIIIAAIFEFAGVMLAGGHVTSTIRKGIIAPGPLEAQPEVLVLGMLASLLAAAVWLMVASAKGWPVSTTHSIIGAIVGFGLVSVGAVVVEWGQIGTIAASWIVSPLAGGFAAFLLMISVQELILDTDAPFARAKRYGPAYVFLVGFIIALVTLFKGLKQLDIDLSVLQSFAAAIGFGLLTGLAGWFFIRKRTMETNLSLEEQYAGVERVFAPMQVFTACAMAFAHGSNDVANGIGPLAAVASVVESGGRVVQEADLPIWILLLGGVGIVIGLATLGYRVMATIGERITELTPTRGFCA